MLKQKRWRSLKYREFVKTLPDVLTGTPSDDAHHIKHIGNMSGGSLTAPDWATMPVNRESHVRIHTNSVHWPKQWKWIGQTLITAMSRRVLEVQDWEAFDRLIGQAIDEGILK